MLAQALKDCLEASKNAGTPLALKTFIVGRNRLENEGAFALAEFFKVRKCSLFSYLRKVSPLILLTFRLLALWKKYRCPRISSGTLESQLWLAL